MTDNNWGRLELVSAGIYDLFAYPDIPVPEITMTFERYADLHAFKRYLLTGEFGRSLMYSSQSTINTFMHEEDMEVHGVKYHLRTKEKRR